MQVLPVSRVLFLTLLAVHSVGARAETPARAGPELRTASTHPMRYLVSLPAGHTKDRTWPVLVVIPDASRDFAGNLAAFEKAARDTPLILVAPFVLTCGGRHRGEPYPYDEKAWKLADTAGDFRFDADGIAAVVADVAKRDRGEEKVAITGWEAGGHTVWAMVFQHPERLLAAIPVSTNYLGRWTSETQFSTSPARATLPVRVLFCDRQEGDLETARQYLLTQSKKAIGDAEARGYKNVTSAILPGRSHGPLAADVLAVIAELAKAR